MSNIKVDKTQKEHLEILLTKRKSDNISTLLNMDEAREEYASEKKVNKKITYRNNKSSAVNIRMKMSDIEKLEKHFKLLGIVNKSTGFRQIIYKYMNENNLL